jgi:hypothetical protein
MSFVYSRLVFQYLSRGSWLHIIVRRLTHKYGTGSTLTDKEKS